MLSAHLVVTDTKYRFERKDLTAPAIIKKLNKRGEKKYLMRWLMDLMRLHISVNYINVKW